MSAVDAAHKISTAMRGDVDLQRAIANTVSRAGASDVFDWCGMYPEESVALARQLGDIDGQIANMSERLARGDLS